LRDEHPDALLKSALEKIVYFEARSEQLHNDLASAQAKIERLKEELGAAAQREIELRREVAELQVKVSRGRKEREELDRLNDALRSERAGLLGKLIEAARIHDSDKKAEAGDSPFDLASFIAELRREALAQKGPPPSAPEQRPAPKDASKGDRTSTPPLQASGTPPANAVPSPPSTVAEHAARLRSEGRLAVSHEQMVELSAIDPPPGRSEETLFGFSIRELCADNPSARKRAAERLRALGNPAAASALATALHAETDPQTQEALLAAFASLAQSEGVSIVSPLLESQIPEVRIAALKALIALDPSQAGPHIAAAMKDNDRAVRRRASLLALGLRGTAALRLGEQAIVDDDQEVRSLAALVLGASSGERARVLLLDALRDKEPKVREAAAQSLSRILGKDVSSVVSLDDPQRRREVRRLASLPTNPVRSDGKTKELVKTYFTVATQATARDEAPEPAMAGAAPTAMPSTFYPVRPKVDLPPASGATRESLCGLLMAEIRSALRGRSLQELAAAGRSPPDEAQQACELLIARGLVLRRGLKYFAA